MVFSLSFLYPDSADINNLYSGGGAQKNASKKKSAKQNEGCSRFSVLPSQRENSHFN